jgi:hypothetical protein
MTRHPYAVTVNGSITMALKPKDGRTLEEEIARRIGILDGTEWYSLILWKVADGKEFDEIDFDTVDEYIQCAGGADGQLTCEIREDGQQYVLGREAAGELSADHVIEWNESRTVVQENEVLDHDETTECFVSYIHTGAEPPGFTRRRIEL